MFKVIRRIPIATTDREHIRLLKQEGGDVTVADVQLNEGLIEQVVLSYPGGSNLILDKYHIKDIIDMMRGLEGIATNCG